MSRIRPPRKPKNEQASITIANQARIIRNLTARCESLDGMRLSSNVSRDNLKLELDRSQCQLTLTEGRLANVQTAYSRLQGWQDCAREMLAKYGPL